MQPKPATSADWLGPRLASAPEHLRERVLTMAADYAGDPAEALADAAIAALESIVERGDHSRAVARDLLAADALATYACEAAVERWAAAGEPKAAVLEQWCGRFAERIAAVGGLRK